MKTNLLTNRNIQHRSPREGLEDFKRAHRSVVMAEFTNLANDWLWTGYVVQETKDAHYFIPISQNCLSADKSYISKTDKQVACTLYTRYVDIDIEEVWNIAMGIIEGPCPIEILRRMWELFGDVPIDEEEDIDLNFLLWEKGTNRYTIWHWFDELCPNGLVKDIVDYKSEEA